MARFLLCPVSISLFCSHTTSRISCQTPAVSAVCRRYTEILVQSRQAVRGIVPLERAVQILKGANRNLLTSPAADLLLCCIEARYAPCSLNSRDSCVALRP